jgi:hypothetical protein
VNGIARAKGGAEVLLLALIDEDLNVLSYLVLLVHDTKAEAGVAPIQVRQDLSKCRSVGGHLAPLAAVGAERGRDVHLHLSGAATSIE